MKTIFKGNPFSIVWNIIDRSTNHPFEFTGMKVEVGLYSDSFNFPLQSYNVNNGTITAGIEANTLPAGVFNIMCRYSTDHEQSYCTYRNAFQISSSPCHASEIVEIESYSSHIDPSSEEPDAPDYSKCQLIAEELFKIPFRLPELTADRALADEHGNRIPDTYVTRQGLTEHIKETYNQQFLENPPLITEGYITPGMLSEETRQMLEATGQEITNLPDGEDLQAVHGVLKFANKGYNPGAYSGLGRQYLRKNIVAGRNILTQSMLQWPNTIYIIQYDYDLQGAEITIPEGCVLDFQGGSFSNGTINLGNCIIKGKNAFSDSIILKSSYLRKINIELFGLDSNKSSDYNRKVVQMLIDNNFPIYIPNSKTIHFDAPLIVKNKIKICGDSINSITAYSHLVFNNSDGIVYLPDTDMWSRDNYIANLKIESKGYCIKVSDETESSKVSVYKSRFEHLELISKEADCFYCGNGIGLNTQILWQCVFTDIHLTGENGFVGIPGLANEFSNITDTRVKNSIFLNSSIRIKFSNFCFNKTKHFAQYNKNASGKWTYVIDIESCNFEDFTSSVIDSSEAVYNAGTTLKIVNSTVLYSTTTVPSGIMDFYIFDIKNLINIVLEQCSVQLYNVKYDDNHAVLKTQVWASDRTLYGHVDKEYNIHYYIGSSIINRKLSPIGMSASPINVWNKYEGLYTPLFITDNIITNKLSLRETIVDVDTLESNTLDVSDNTMYILTGTLDKTISVIHKTKGYINPTCSETTIYNNSNNTFVIVDNSNTTALVGNRINLYPKCSVTLQFNPTDNYTAWKQVTEVTNIKHGGNSENRPVFLYQPQNDKGFQYFDTTLNKPIWWTGDKWVDATGAEV